MPVSVAGFGDVGAFGKLAADCKPKRWQDRAGADTRVTRAFNEQDKFEQLPLCHPSFVAWVWLGLGHSLTRPPGLNPLIFGAWVRQHDEKFQAEQLVLIP